MDLNKLYKMQEELDRHILGNLFAREEIQMSKEGLLDNTVLALLVEVGELANTTRCFKHWSTKGMMDKAVILDELADVWHFYLSIGNQISVKLTHYHRAGKDTGPKLIKMFNNLYSWVNRLNDSIAISAYGEVEYIQMGLWLGDIGYKLGFTNQEVEQAYLKKHEENYKRQREGY